MRDAAALVDLSTGFAKNRLRFRRMCEDEPFQLIGVGNCQQIGDRLGMTSDDDRPILAFLGTGGLGKPALQAEDFAVVRDCALEALFQRHFRRPLEHRFGASDIGTALFGVVGGQGFVLEC